MLTQSILFTEQSESGDFVVLHLFSLLEHVGS